MAMAHKVMIDEPVEAGGTDKGMNPGEYLLVALAGYKALGFKSFAKAKDLAYESLEIEVEGNVDVSELIKGDPIAKLIPSFIGFPLFTRIFLRRKSSSASISRVTLRISAS